MTLYPRICLPVKMQGCAPRWRPCYGCLLRWHHVSNMISSHQPKHDFISTAISSKASSTVNCAAAPVPSADHALLNTHAQYRLTCARWHTHAHSYTETSSTRACKDRWCMQTVQQFISLSSLFIQVTILLVMCQMLEMKNYFLVSSLQECSFDIH